MHRTRKTSFDFRLVVSRTRLKGDRSSPRLNP